MLEANTDRSYFMIGAVIIAAVLIAGATWVFKEQLFNTTTGASRGIIPKLVDSINAKATSALSGVNP